jgi:hypothetical protein
MRTPILPLPAIGGLLRAFQRGENITPGNRYGQITWADYVAKEPRSR